jgi:hypothetical protein
MTFLWLLTLTLSFTLVWGAEIVKVPLIKRSIPEGSRLSKRSTTIAYAPLTDDVQPRANLTFDFAYLGEVTIGDPPQTFLMGNDLSLKVLICQTSIPVQESFGSQMSIVEGVMCPMRNYSIELYPVQAYLSIRLLSSFMSKASHHPLCPLIHCRCG